MYQTDLIQAESFVRRIVTDVVDGESRCYPKVFDCPVCKHETLSDSRYIKDKAGEKVPVRYCFSCGNNFSKQTTWLKADK